MRIALVALFAFLLSGCSVAHNRQSGSFSLGVPIAGLEIIDMSLSFENEQDMGVDDSLRAKDDAEDAAPVNSAAEPLDSKKDSSGGNAVFTLIPLLALMAKKLLTGDADEQAA